MKFFAGFLVALTVTIVWQTSVISGEETGPAMQDTNDTVQQEYMANGRVPFRPAGLD